MVALVKCINISKTYNFEKNIIQALENINIEINNGDFICLQGPSGSGKTSLLNILGLLDYASSGTLVIDGNSINTMDTASINQLRIKLSCNVFQQPNLNHSLTIYKNIEIPLLIQKTMKGAADRKRKIIELLDILDLKNKAHNYPSQLSVGQQQRIEIAISIVHDPVLLLMDEPTGSLVRENSDFIVDLL